MRCPHCGKLGSRVLDSRPAEENRSVRRRRECPHCQRRFTTYERIDEAPLMVLKRDGRRERFQRDKILRGVVTACEKRPVSMDDLQNLVNDVEYQIRADASEEVTSRDIGERVMERLRELDEVAYIRFASVYRLFADVEAFRREVAQLRRDREDERRHRGE
ncbi:MAG: transcriptional regulator NrdR [Bacillota bacterium]